MIRIGPAALWLFCGQVRYIPHPRMPIPTHVCQFTEPNFSATDELFHGRDVCEKAVWELDSPSLYCLRIFPELLFGPVAFHRQWWCGNFQGHFPHMLIQKCLAKVFPVGWLRSFIRINLIPFKLSG